MSSPLIYGANNLANNIQNGQLSGNGTLLTYNGPKNYISYGNFENQSTTGWSLGTVGTLTNNIPTGTPTFGSGASGNLSIAVVTSGQLAGAYSLSYASSAATTQGNMLASQAYSIDIEDQAKVLTWKFYYAVNSGASNCNFSGTASNSFGVAIYDVTNSVWLSSTANFGMVQSTGVGYVTGTCQTNSTTASLRFVIYNANATSGAATLYFDDFFLGPQTAPLGPAMTDWVACPSTIIPTSAWGTPTNVSIFSRRDGNDLIVQGSFIAGSTTTSAPYLSLSYNGGLGNVTVDTTKIGTATNNIVGSLAYGGASGAVWYVLAPTSNQTYVQFGFSNSSTVGTTPISNCTNYFGGSTPVTFYFRVPIVGWSSNAVQSSDEDSRVCAAKYTATGASVTANNPVNFNNSIYDTHAAVTTGSSWKFTAPITGYYRISLSSYYGSSAPTNQLYKNGSFYEYLNTNISGTNTSASDTIQLNAGDYIDVRPDATATTGGASFNHIQIERVSGPAVVQNTESINARYINNSGTSVGTSLTAIPFPVQSFDTHGAMNGSTGVYTVPVSGKYRVSTFLIMGPITTSSSLQANVYKNGSSYAVLAFVVGNGASGEYYATNGTDVVQCNAGDTLAIYASAAVATALNSTPGSNIFAIERIGN